jgi:chromate transporter
MAHHPPEPVPLTELAAVFLKLGTIAFGGPAAHIAMMEQEFVRRRHWLTEGDFLDRLATANLIPGPSSTELAIFIGYSKRGWRGLIVAGACFILPAAVLVSCIAAAYLRFGSLPQAQGVLYAIKPVVIAIIVQALWNLGHTAVKTPFLGLLAALAVILGFLGLDPLIVLACAGLASASRKLLTRPLRSVLALPLFTHSLALGIAAGTQALPVTLLRLFLSFLKIGSVVFGSGYVLLVFLRGEYITRLHWLTEKQLIDAVAVGQFTPGPVFTTATFIGYLLAGIRGAVVATIGIFLPGFLLVALSGPLIPKLRRSPLAGATLDGIVVGSLSLMGVVAWQLARSAIVDGFTLLIGALSLIALIGLRTSSARLIVAAALLGWIVKAH